MIKVRTPEPIAKFRLDLCQGDHAAGILSCYYCGQLSLYLRGYYDWEVRFDGEPTGQGTCAPGPSF